jgi:hypothetical protein
LAAREALRRKRLKEGEAENALTPNCKRAAVQVLREQFGAAEPREMTWHRASGAVATKSALAYRGGFTARRIYQLSR